MPSDYEFDNTDRQILSLLSKDGRLAYTEIAKKLFVSGGTVHVRMRKMEEAGIVKGSQILLDYNKLGYDITAFLGIYLKSSDLYDEVANAFQNIHEIIELHYTTGEYSMFAKVVCRDTAHLRDLLHDKIQKIKGIQRTETFISLLKGFDRPAQLI